MMKLLNKLTITLFALGTILWSCDSLIYDDLADCPQGVYLKFYSMTPCETDSSFIGEVVSLHVFAFDKNDKLVITHKEGKVNLSRNFEVLMPVSDGDYSFVAWAGINDDFTLGSFTPGTTTKEDVMLTLKTAENVAAKLGATKVWQGESASVFLPSPDEFASVYKYAAVNLREVTNRITLIIDYDPGFLQVATSDFEVTLASENGTMLINGALASASQRISYPSYNEKDETKTISWQFTVMDLVEGKYNNLRIYYPGTDQEVFNGDLLKDLILNTEGNISLACENDFVIRTNLKSLETHLSADITVNNWKVHSYEWEG